MNHRYPYKGEPARSFMIRRLGYACINMQIGGDCKDSLLKHAGVRCGSCLRCTVGSDSATKRAKVFTSRSITLATARSYDTRQDFLDRISELLTANARDLLRILQWNEANDIRLFRLSSEMAPFMTHPDFAYSISDLDPSVSEALAECGRYAADHGHRLSSHPGPFNVLASPNPRVVDNTIRELDAQAELFDVIGLPRDHNAKINIHVGGAYGDPDSALDRWCTNFARLSESARSRLTVENDDRASLYSTRDLYDKVHARTGVPIVFDYHHHQFCTGGDSEAEALALAVLTWPKGIVPTVHYSESMEHHHGGGDPTPAHSFDTFSLPDTYGHKIDVMVEAKGKELAIVRHMGAEY